MTYRVEVRGEAEREVAAAQSWYEARRAGLGGAFHDAFSTIIDRLTETPLIYPMVYRNVRRAGVKRFPYLVWYRVTGFEVVVLACTHAKINPRPLATRLRRV